jgi:hypothetical protein
MKTYAYTGPYRNQFDTPGAIRTKINDAPAPENFVTLEALKGKQRLGEAPADYAARSSIVRTIESAVETGDPLRPLPPRNDDGKFVLLSLEP